MTTSKASRALRPLIQTTNVLVLAMVLMLLGACSLMPKSGPLADGAAWQKTCPKQKLAEFVSFDISKSSAPEPFGAGQDQWPVLRDAVARAAVCDGHLLVMAFAGTSANPVQLWDGQPSLPGATDNARYRRLDKVVDEISHQVANTYNGVLNEGDFSGSDIIGQLRLAEEYAQQVGPDTHLAATIVTDGLQSVTAKRVVIRDQEDARAYADSVALPQLSGELLFTGLGDRLDGKEVPTVVVENLKAIYTRVCERTGASPCQAVTDYTSPIGSGS